MCSATEKSNLIALSPRSSASHKKKSVVWQFLAGNPSQHPDQPKLSRKTVPDDKSFQCWLWLGNVKLCWFSPFAVAFDPRSESESERERESDHSDRSESPRLLVICVGPVHCLCWSLLFALL